MVQRLDFMIEMLMIISSKSHAQPTIQRNKLADLYPRLAGLVKDEDNITLALNEEYVQMGEAPMLKEGDTVALIPPISGG